MEHVEHALHVGDIEVSEVQGFQGRASEEHKTHVRNYFRVEVLQSLNGRQGLQALRDVGFLVESSVEHPPC